MVLIDATIADGFLVVLLDLQALISPRKWKIDPRHNPSDKTLDQYLDASFGLGLEQDAVASCRYMHLWSE
jgi:hypothetical protein